MMNVKTYLFPDPDKMNYAVAQPAAGEDLPLLIYLHGAGERGKNFPHVYRHGIPKLIAEGREYPAVVLIPQCPAQFIWNNMVKELKALIDSIIEEYGIQRDRVVLTGSSMGGYGTWEMAMCYPELFAAIAPVAGGGVMWRAEKLRHVPVFAYHGEADATVPLSQSQIMVEYTARAGGSAELVVLPGYGHNDGINYAYRETDLVDRLLGTRKQNFDRVPEPFEKWY
ncbi:MAG: prolyl oligopeptidase family serine peptidase [Clostridia bacterium]|nr:prolyl oligopeptidase family serine peptidase [Clostridia bacterium]